MTTIIIILVIIIIIIVIYRYERLHKTIFALLTLTFANGMNEIRVLVSHLFPSRADTMHIYDKTQLLSIVYRMNKSVQKDILGKDMYLLCPVLHRHFGKFFHD